jgi:hypothetical protein
MRTPRSLLIAVIPLIACGGKTDAVSEPLPQDAGIPDGQAPDVAAEAGLPCGADSGREVTIASLGVPDSGFPYQGLAMVADRGEVYWSVRAVPDTTAGLVLKVPRCGGGPTTIAARQDDATNLAVQGESVFWGTMGDDGSGQSHGAVMRAPIAGGSVATLVTNTAIYRGGLAVDAVSVYSVGWLSTVSQNSGAWKVPIAGGPPVGFGPNQIFTSIAVDARQIFLAQAVTDLSMSRILSVPLSGGDPTVLVPSGVGFTPWVLDDTSIYYVAAPSTLTRLAKNGGTPTALGSVALKAMAVDDTDVYWLEGDVTTGAPNAIKRMPKGGGATTTLSHSYATAIAVDDAYVYWLRSGDVVRLAK